LAPPDNLYLMAPIQTTKKIIAKALATFFIFLKKEQNIRDEAEQIRLQAQKNNDQKKIQKIKNKIKNIK